MAFKLVSDTGWSTTCQGITQAERMARNHTTRHGAEVEIFNLDEPVGFQWARREGRTLQHFRLEATTLRDALGRVWTQVDASPGEPCLL